MMASILAALKALPEIVGLIRELVDGVKVLAAQNQKMQEDKWVYQAKEIALQVAHAKTDEERKELAKKLSDHWLNQP